ncbi:MAG TPA: alcohol dehydrogenase catalytic domain-containing protein, partial [Myxococcaceae bacterium]|nr:alcohol dehydrogenase catalytic domain-containing protein [Myxococcaceae bacterium]
MRANVFRGPGKFGIEEVRRPTIGLGDALVRTTLTTICGTDLHIVRGEYPVDPGRIIGHELVGVVEAVGAGVTSAAVGDRVLVGAITPCGQCRACLSGVGAQCGQDAGVSALGGWRLGNTLHGTQAELVRVPFAQANLARIPEDLSDEQVVLLADIASTGFSGAESGGVRLGDAVAVFAQGPIGLCANLGARLMGAALVIGVESDAYRRKVARRFG